MADSIKELIFKNLDTTLKTVTVDNGYDLTVQKVNRVPIDVMQNPIFPLIELHEVNESKKEGYPATFTDCQMQLRIIFWNDQWIDPHQRAIQFCCAIEKAVGVDRTRGGVAYDTDVVGTTFFLDEEIFPYGGGEVLVIIYYRHRVYDPFTQ